MKRSDFTIALSIFLLFLTLYARTAARGLLFGDAAEFQTIGYTLGIAHPPGYPIYIAIAKIFTYLPLGEIAYRVNLLSVFFGAMTVALIYFIARTLEAGSASAAFGSVLLGLTPVFWKHAAMAEVYALSSASLAFIFLALLNWEKSKKRSWLFIFGMLLGISPGIHFTVTLVALPVLFYLRMKGGQPAEKAKYTFLGMCIGFSIFLLSFYLLDQRNAAAGFYNSVALPSLSVWQMKISDFNSPLEHLVFLTFPPQFRGQFLAVPFNQAIHRLVEFAHTFTALSIFGFMGILFLFIPLPGHPPRRTEGWLLVSTLLILIIFATSYNVADFIVFYIPSILILAICAALDMQMIINIIGRFKNFQPVLSILVYTICCLAGTLGLVRTIPYAWKNRMPPGLEEKYVFGFQHPGAYRLNAEKIVNKIEDNAIVFTNWDRVYGLYYVSHVLQGRTEMTFHETYPQKDEYLPAESLLAYIDKSIDQRPIYFTSYPDSLDETYQVIQIAERLFQILRK